jgi:hypothetical protein
MRKSVTLAFASAGIAACSTPPPQAPDNTPTRPTAVLETVVTSGGIMGYLPFQSTDKRWVRTDMRRHEHDTKGTGTFSGFLVTAMTGQSDTTIDRMDRNVAWTLNHGKKEYTECPVHGCPTPPPAPTRPEPKAEEKKNEPRQQSEPDCTMRISRTSVDVKATGQKRNINGFDTEQYTVAWLVTMQDNQKRQTVSTLSMDLWTSPVTPQMRQAFGMEESFNRAYVAGIPRSKPAATVVPTAPGATEIVPADASRLMLGYLSSLSPADRAAFMRAGKQLEQIKGYPIQSKMEWSLDGNACAPKESQSQQRSQQPADLAGQAAAALGGLFSKKDDAKDAKKPILSFSTEVKSLKVEPVRDSVFTVPANYKRVN